MSVFSVPFIAILLICIGQVFCQPKTTGQIASNSELNESGVASPEKDRFEPVAVVELFTSQGCSSCPPADKVLMDLTAQASKEKKNVFALSFHVDYWNYIGWKDPYSSAAFSDRQRAYAQAFGSTRIYTPQMIVNGKTEFVGSSEAKAHRVVLDALSRPASASVEIVADTNKENNELHIDYKVYGQSENTVLRIAIVEKHAETSVSRGENSGRMLSHANVVRAFRSIKVGAEGEGNVRLKKPGDLKSQNMEIIAYLQEVDSMEILAAAAIR